MRRITIYAMQVGEHWEVSSSQRGSAPEHYASRAQALEAACAVARRMWDVDRIATAVAVSEDDGGWHQAATFGDLLDF
jgi:hypothetical protein